MTHTVHKCLLMPGEASSALHYTQTGGSHPTTWIVDTGAGVSMTWDRTKFKPETLVAFKGGSAQVGSGALCPATHRGVLSDIHVRVHGTGKAATLPTIKVAWLVPDIVFNILSTSALEEVGVGMHTCVPGPLRNFLMVNNTNSQVSLRKYQQIYTLKTIKSTPCLRASPNTRKLNESVALQKRSHVDIDLWFVFGREKPVVSLVSVPASTSDAFDMNALHIGDELPDEQHCFTVDTYCDDFGRVIENCSEDLDLTLDDVKRGLGICANMGAVPYHIYSDPGAPQETIDFIQWYGAGESVHGPESDQDVSAYNPSAVCCDTECENTCCVSHICSVHKGGVNKTSPYHLAKRNMRLQHARHGHRNESLLYKASQDGAIRGLDLKSAKSCNCRVCNLCKHRRQTFRKVVKSKDQIQYEDGLETCTIDYVGPMRKVSKMGNTGAHLAMHLGCRTQSGKQPTRFVRVYPVKYKSQAPQCMEDFQCYLMAAFERWVRHWHMDNAAEYSSRHIQELQYKYKFNVTHSPQYTAVRNREIESVNNQLCEMALCMMVHGGAPAWSWDLALKLAGHIWNCTPPQDGGMSPIEAISGVKPDTSMLRVFWSPCFPLYFKEEGRYKFDLHSRGDLNNVCRFVGFHEEQPDSWMYYDPVRNKISWNAHMRFDESEFDGSNDLWEEPVSRDAEALLDELAAELNLDVQAEPNEDEDEVDDNPLRPPTVTPEAEANGGEDWSYGDDHGHVQDSVSYMPNPNDDMEAVYQPLPMQQVATPSPSPPQGRPVRNARRPDFYVAGPAQRPSMVPPHSASGGESTGLLSSEEAREALQGVTPPSDIPQVWSPNGIRDWSEGESDEEIITHVNNAIAYVQNHLALERAKEVVEYCNLAATVQYAFNVLGEVQGRLRDPASYKEALACPDWDKFEDAIQDEMKSMEANGVGEPIAEGSLPPGVNIMKMKGVFTRKYDEQGTLERHKFRLVGCGYSQVEGLDYFETHAGTVSMVVVRIMMAAIAAMNLHTRLFDIGTAFLEGELEEEIYVRLPSYLGGGIWRLFKALYGLKQAGHIFVKLLNGFLRALGFKQSKTEPQLFTLITKLEGDELKKADLPSRWNGYGYCIVSTYVDDIPAAANSPFLLDWVEDELKHRFKKVTCKDLRWFIGHQISITPGRVEISQGQYVMQLIKRFEYELNLFCGKPIGGGGTIVPTARTPAEPGWVPSKAECPQTEEDRLYCQSLPYREIVGGLLYCANSTRIDILTITSQLARFMSNFGFGHFMGALRVLRYLMVNPGRSLVYEDLGADSNRNMLATYDVDASFADCPDTARSRYGIIGKLQGAFIDSKTGILKNVRVSTMDAETGALAQCTLRVLVTRRYLEDIGFPQYDPTPIGEDNNAALIFSKRPVSSRRSRHIHVDHHLTRENQNEFKTIAVFRQPSAKVESDQLTKNLGFILLDKHSTSSMNSPTRVSIESLD